MPDTVLNWGVDVILYLQSLGSWLVVPMNVITVAGSSSLLLVITAIIYWCVDTKWGLRLAVTLTLTVALNEILKVAIHDPRPYWYDPRVQLLTSPHGSFGMPSGHSATALAGWGLLAVFLATGWGWLIGAVLTLLVGLSRVYLGVHFPSDVLAGWAIGALIALLVLRLEGPVLAGMRRTSEATRIAVVLVITLLLATLGAVVSLGVTTSWQVPDEWTSNAARQAPNHSLEPLSVANVVSLTGLLSGLLIGAIVLNARGGLDVRGSRSQLLRRFILGILGILILWLGLDGLFGLLSSGEGLLAHVPRYLRYVLLGMWVTALAPAIFIRAGLARTNLVHQLT
jgi:membrane-associated phospholipid phosphatase